MATIGYSNLVEFDPKHSLPAGLYIEKTFCRMTYCDVVLNIRYHDGDLEGLHEAAYLFEKHGFELPEGFCIWKMPDNNSTYHGPGELG